MTVELTTKPVSADVEQIELFSIDGKSYSIPNKPRVNVALRYLKLAREQGVDAAAAYLIESLIGADGYEALMNYEDLTSEELASIVSAAQKATLGGLEAPKGN